MIKKNPNLSKGGVLGWAIGAFLSVSAYSTSAVVAPFMLAIAFSRLNVRGTDIVLISLWFLITFWILVKSFLFWNSSDHLLEELFLITVLTTFSVFKIRSFILYGVIAAFVPIVLLDAISNLLQLSTGTDFFGNTPDLYRSDGTRLVGIFGHSFISLGLYLSAFLLFRASNFTRVTSYIPVLFMLLVGSLRGYIFPLLLILYNFLFRRNWSFVFFTSLIIATAVAAATFYSVSSGLNSATSGNAYRIFAWQNAIIEIGQHPLFGSETPPPTLPENFSVNEQNLIYFQIFESKLLQDAVRYGLPLALLKVCFFYCLGKMHYKKIILKINSFQEVKNFISSFIIIDYAIFAYFNMPVVALTAGIILGSITLKDYRISQKFEHT